jgi:tetratricopeptide (TPR) repeat protein
MGGSKLNHEGKSRSDLPVVLLLFTLAVVIRTLYLIQLRSSPAFAVPIIDSTTYDAQAVQIASGAPAPRLPFYQPPLYPYFLAGIYALFGHSVSLARFAQGFLGSLNCVLVFLLGRRLFGRAVGLIAGIGMAVYGPAVFFDGELLAPVLAIALDLTALIFIARALEETRARDWAVGGLALGLSAITWPNILLFAPAAALLAPLRAFRGATPGERPRVVRAAIRGPILLIAAVLLPIVIVTARNIAVSGEFVPISTNGGINFFIGNNPEMEATRAVRPGYHWIRLAHLPRNEAGIFKESEASGWFFRKGIAWAAKAPGDYLLLQLHKLREYWVSFEIKRNQDLYFNALHSSVLRILVFRIGPWGFPFGVVGAAALGGAWMLRRDRRATILLLFVGTQVVAVVAFFVTDRYRLPTIPALLILGAAWVEQVARAVRGKTRRDLVRLVTPALIFGLLIGFAGRAPAGNSEGETLLYVGVTKQERGDLKGAEDLLRRAIALDPRLPDTHFHLGSVLFSFPARRGEAEMEYRKCLELEPDHAGARVQLGVCLLVSRRADEALTELQRAVATDPYDERGQYFLGQALAEKGETEAAIRAFRRAIQIEPRYADSYYPLGQLTATALHDPKGAIEILERGIRLNPSHRQAAAAREMIRSMTTKSD